MKKKTIACEFTRKEFRELLQLVHIGEYVRNGALEVNDTYDSKRDHELEQRLHAIALAERLPYVGTYQSGFVGLSDALEEEVHTLIDEYEDEYFWDELERRLGMRDFDRTMTPVDRAHIEAHRGMLPDRVLKIYEKYGNEFETYGVDRLEINPNAAVSDVRELL